MAGPEFVFDFRVILGPLILILDHERDRRTGGDLDAGFVREHARQDFNPVRLLPLRRKPRLPRPAFIEIRLDVGFAERNSRRAAIDHAADCRPMAFAPGGDAKHVAEGVIGHDGFGLSKPGQFIFFNHQHLILRHVKMHDLLRRELKKMAAQAPAYPAMRDNHGVGGHIGKPIYAAGVKFAVSFPAGRGEIPGVCLPPRRTYRTCLRRFRPSSCRPMPRSGFPEALRRCDRPGERAPSRSARFPWSDAL